MSNYCSLWVSNVHVVDIMVFLLKFWLKRAHYVIEAGSIWLHSINHWSSVALNPISHAISRILQSRDKYSCSHSDQRGTCSEMFVTRLFFIIQRSTCIHNGLRWSDSDIIDLHDVQCVYRYCHRRCLLLAKKLPNARHIHTSVNKERSMRQKTLWVSLACREWVTAE